MICRQFHNSLIETQTQEYISLNIHAKKYTNLFINIVP